MKLLIFIHCFRHTVSYVSLSDEKKYPNRVLNKTNKHKADFIVRNTHRST